MPEDENQTYPHQAVSANGKAERFIQTALREWAKLTKGSSRRSQLEWSAEGYASAYQTSDQRAQDLPYWTHQYNLHRPTRQPKINAAHISRLGLTGDNLLRHHGEEVPESDAPQAAILTVQWSDFVMYRTLTNMIVSKRSMIIALVLFTMCIHTPLIASAQTTDQIQLLLNQIRDLPQRPPHSASTETTRTDVFQEYLHLAHEVVMS
jgi:hypothetical protein